MAFEKPGREGGAKEKGREIDRQKASVCMCVLCEWSQVENQVYSVQLLHTLGMRMIDVANAYSLMMSPVSPSSHWTTVSAVMGGNI